MPCFAPLEGLYFLGRTDKSTLVANFRIDTLVTRQEWVDTNFVCPDDKIAQRRDKDGQI